MISNDFIEQRVNVLVHRVDRLSKGDTTLRSLVAVTRKILNEVADIAHEEGFQEGTACLEDIVAVSVRDALAASKRKRK